MQKSERPESHNTTLLASMGVLSIVFHSHQCVHSTLTPHMCMADIVGVNLVACVLLYFCTPFPLWWYVLWVVPVYLLFADCTSDHEYALMHGSWHILAAVLFGVAIYLSQKKLYRHVRVESTRQREKAARKRTDFPTTNSTCEMHWIRSVQKA